MVSHFAVQKCRPGKTSSHRELLLAWPPLVEFAPSPSPVLIGLSLRGIIRGSIDEDRSVTSDQPESPKRSGSSRGSRISKKVWIKASPETVYSALTESRELVRWFCDRASCDAREGKELVADWKTGKSSQKGRALFSRVVPGSILELVWIDDGNGVQPQGSKHCLSYEIRSKAGMTELIMIDKDDSCPDDEASEFLDKGWNSVLLELKDYCERKERSAKLHADPKSRSQKASR